MKSLEKNRSTKRPRTRTPSYVHPDEEVVWGDGREVAAVEPDPDYVREQQALQRPSSELRTFIATVNARRRSKGSRSIWLPASFRRVGRHVGIWRPGRSRAPRRAPVKSASATTRSNSSKTSSSKGADPPPGDSEPPLEARAPELLRGLNAVIVSDQTAALVGMDGRQFRRFVRQHEIPHRVWGRHVFARLDRMIEALGGDDPAAAQPSSSLPTALDEATVIELAARSRRKGSAS